MLRIPPVIFVKDDVNYHFNYVERMVMAAIVRGPLRLCAKVREMSMEFCFCLRLKPHS